LKEGLFESSEVNDRRRGVPREARGVPGQFAPRFACFDGVRNMSSEMPVIRVTAGGICAPSGSAIRRARGCVTPLRT
jgi:hypothetical protein